MEQVLTGELRHSKRREPLGFAFIGLVLFLIVYFARPQDWIPGLTAVPLAKMAAILILIALAFSYRDIRWHMPSEIVFFSLLMVQLCLTVPFSPVWRGGAFNVMIDFSKVLPLVIAIYGTVRSMKRLQWIVFVQAASVAAIAIISLVKARTLGGRLQGALSGVYGNPNDLAFAIDLALPLCLALALTTRSRWNKIAWTFAMLAMIYTVVLTASRAGAIALVVAALVCLWQLGVKSRRFYLLLLIPVAMMIIWLRGGDVLRERTGVSDESARQRKELLLKSLKITAQHPLFGVGPGNFVIVSGVWHVTHNSYTEMSAEGGIPAFLLYVLILWRGIANLREIRKYRKTRRRIRLFSLALEASLAAYLVGSFFASVEYLMFPYCLVAYTSALRLIVQRERTASSWAPKSDLTPAQVEVTVWQ